MLRIQNIGASQKNKVNYWPIVSKFDGLGDEIPSLLQLNDEQLKTHFALLHQSNFEKYSQLVMESLSTIYAGYFGYQDSPFAGANDQLYLSLIRLKLFLEHEMNSKIIKAKAFTFSLAGKYFFQSFQ